MFHGVVFVEFDELSFGYSLRTLTARCVVWLTRHSIAKAGPRMVDGILWQRMPAVPTSRANGSAASCDVLWLLDARCARRTKLTADLMPSAPVDSVLSLYTLDNFFSRILWQSALAEDRLCAAPQCPS